MNWEKDGFYSSPHRDSDGVASGTLSRNAAIKIFLSFGLGTSFLLWGNYLIQHRRDSTSDYGQVDDIHPPLAAPTNNAATAVQSQESPGLNPQALEMYRTQVDIFSREPQLSGEAINPSPGQVVEYVRQRAESVYGVPQLWALAIFKYASEFLMYYWNRDFPPLVNAEGDSVRWGISQINQKYWGWLPHFELVTSNWQTNVETGLLAMHHARNLFPPKTSEDREWIACYGEYQPDFVAKVHEHYNRLAWAQENPVGSPLPKGFVVTGGLHGTPLGMDLGWSGNPAPEEFPLPLYSRLYGQVTHVVDENHTQDDPDKIGNTRVVTKSKNGEWEAGYLHLDKVFVKQGQSVSWGETIGIMGARGDRLYSRWRARPIHVHYWLRNLISGQYIDPMGWIYQ